MSADRRAHLFALEVFAKFAAFGASFTIAVYFLNHPYVEVLLVIFLVPTAVGTILAIGVLFPSLLPHVNPARRVENAKPPSDS